jgi:glutaredoxin 3
MTEGSCESVSDFQSNCAHLPISPICPAFTAGRRMLRERLGRSIVLSLKVRQMAPVTIFTKAWCPYCSSAKQLLASKGVDFEERDITGDPALRAEMIQRAGGRSTVPQIFIGERHVGGCDDLHALDRRGELDRALAA